MEKEFDASLPNPENINNDAMDFSCDFIVDVLDFETGAVVSEPQQTRIEVLLPDRIVATTVNNNSGASRVDINTSMIGIDIICNRINDEIDSRVKFEFYTSSDPSYGRMNFTGVVQQPDLSNGATFNVNNGKIVIEFELIKFCTHDIPAIVEYKAWNTNGQTYMGQLEINFTYSAD